MFLDGGEHTAVGAVVRLDQLVGPQARDDAPAQDFPLDQSGPPLVPGPAQHPHRPGEHLVGAAGHLVHRTQVAAGPLGVFQRLRQHPQYPTALELIEANGSVSASEIVEALGRKVPIKAVQAELTALLDQELLCPVPNSPR
ncbi:hypothetical protein [Streptomyces sp. NRRL S-350]|uniref:hypothetical protein n=1 Tax=Streptomyces sp. NRRL S-350 TaxID=1463902 RepID=UPI00131AF781|nr:hypothetical protein [Streptomyces sp. NRRL S-350]